LLHLKQMFNSVNLQHNSEIRNGDRLEIYIVFASDMKKINDFYVPAACSVVKKQERNYFNIFIFSALKVMGICFSNYHCWRSLE